ncbi:MAG: DUF6268 family outer membrane beta-barrel protein [Flavobacteriales bacterium]|nr:DUF6268 family outer membrane beta-barrel protein [Flavobacteriales bacterium]
MKRGIAILLVLGSWGVLAAQDSTVFCIPTIEGQPRPKGLELTYERMMDYGIQGTRNDVASGDYTTEVRRNARFNSKLRFPVFIRRNFKLNMSLGYATENYELDNSGGYGSQVLSLLHEKQLRSIQAGLYIVKPFIGNKYLVVRTNSSMNDDGTGTFASKNNALKHEVAAVYGVKRDPRFSFGFGVAFSYTLGHASFLPVVAYQRSIDRHWGVDVLLPAHARVYYELGKSNRLLAGVKVEGTNYNIRLQEQGLNGVYYLERSDLRVFVRYEREIHDWLWFGADAGLNMNLDLSLVTDHGTQRGEVILSNTVNNAFYFGAGFFVVPPKSMWP